MPTLLEISQDLLDLEEHLYALGGDVEAAGTLLDDWLETKGREKEKLDNYAALICELETRAEARKAEARRLQERARIDAEQAARLKERLKAHFLRHDEKVVETARYRIALAGNGGKRPVELAVSPEQLPEAYRRARITYSPDYEALREALDRDLEVVDEEGCVVAWYGEQGCHLRIR